MLLGTFICMLAMLLLGFTRPVASIFTSKGSHANDTLTIWLAILSIYLIDFAINAVQAVDRALLVDTVPPSEQLSGNAWAARMLGVGSVVGFFVGNIDLIRIFPFLGDTQLEVLSVVVSILLLAGHLVMSILVKERVLLKTEGANKVSKSGAFLQELKAIWANIRTLPWVIQQICYIQFFAWIAWFPVLFYSTLYVGDLHKQSSPIPTTDAARELLDAEATRLGSRALFFSSLLALLANVVLPAFIPEANPPQSPRRGNTLPFWRRLTQVPAVLHVHLATLWALSHLIFAGCMFATFFTRTVPGATILITITGFSWAITQWAPFSLLAEAILTEPGPAAGEDGTFIRLEDSRTPRPNADGESQSFLARQDSESESDDEDADSSKSARRAFLGTNSAAQVSSMNVRGSGSGHSDDDYEFVDGRRGDRASGSDDFNPDFEPSQSRGGLSGKAGIILGIHNVFIVIPQFLVTALSSVIFAIFDPQKSVVPGHSATNATVVATAGNITTLLEDTILPRALEHAGRAEAEAASSGSIVYIFRFGGVTAMVAFVLCWRLATVLRHR